MSIAAESFFDLSCQYAKRKRDIEVVCSSPEERTCADIIAFGEPGKSLGSLDTSTTPRLLSNRKQESRK